MMTDEQYAKDTACPPKQFRWVQVFFLFAGLDIIIILISLTMMHTTLTSFNVLVGKVDRLTQQQSWVASLRSTLLNVNVAGNDVFETRNVPVERGRYEVSRKELSLLLEAGSHYGIDTARFEDHVAKMEHAEEDIFDLFGGVTGLDLNKFDRQAKAGEGMAIMDREQFYSMQALSEMEAASRDRSVALMREQHQVLERKRTAEWIFALFAFLAVARILFFGRQLHVTYESYLAEQAHLVEELKNSKDELQNTTISKNYVDHIVSSIPDALIVVNEDTTIRMINSETCNLLGYTKKELVGNDVSLMFTEEEESLLKGTRLKQLIEQGSIRNFHMTFKAKSGEKIPVSFSGSVMKSKEGKIEGIVGIARDMREMKRLFEKEKELTFVATKAAEAEKKKSIELESAFEELEKSQDITLNYMEDLEIQRKEFERQYEETKQKSKSLKQTQAASLNIMEDLDLKRKEVEEREKKLKETQAMLVQAGKLSAMGQLGAGIAHELNQPLAAIRGYTQVLIEEIKKNDPHLEDLKMIEEQTGRMGTIVNNIRTFARDSKFTLELIDIHKPIEDAFTLLTTQLTNHNIEVVKDYGQDIPRIKADSSQLQQVFINLITNARDALDQNNGGKIWVSTRTLKLDNRKTDLNVAISFKNEGTPIPEEILHRIFDPFFTTKDSGKGTGLGLSISYGIIKDHQGEIMVANKEDGVEFVIHLPLTRPSLHK